MVCIWIDLIADVLLVASLPVIAARTQQSSNYRTETASIKPFPFAQNNTAGPTCPGQILGPWPNDKNASASWAMTGPFEFSVPAFPSSASSRSASIHLHHHRIARGGGFSCAREVEGEIKREGVQRSQHYRENEMRKQGTEN